MEKEVRLKVGELTAREEAGRGIVRMDSKTMRELGIKEGDIVEIEGSKKTAAIAVRAYPADVGLNIIRMDGITRRNAGSAVGEYVKVRKANVKPAKRVVLAPAQKGIILHISPNLIKQNIYMRPVVKGDIIVPSPVIRKRRGGTIFEEIFGMDLAEFDIFFTPFPRETRFVVTNTEPLGIVKIDDDTELEILPELPATLKLEEKAIPVVTYEDIGGMKEVIQKVREMIELPLRHPELFERLGVEPPKGILLYGPPGCGKTLLAKAVANESGANFISISGPEVMCLDSNTPLIVDNEVKKISDIFKERKSVLSKGKNHITYSIKGHLIGIRNPSFSANPTELTEITKISLPYYFTLKLKNCCYNISSNHPVLTLSKNGLKWKIPKELDGNEKIVVKVIKKLKEPSIQLNEKLRNKFPKKINKNLAFLLGLMAGDGYIGEDNITFSSKDKKLHVIFREIMKKEFGIENYSEYFEDVVMRTVFYSKPLVNFFVNLGFEKGKKDYKEFLRKYLIKLDQSLLVYFILGLIASDGIQNKYSLVIYSKDKKSLEKLANISFSRGILFKGPKPHKNKFGKMYKIVLSGKYNLELFKKLSEGSYIRIKTIIPKKSFEYLPYLVADILKELFIKYRIKYGKNWKIEPYLNKRKRLTLASLEKIIKFFKKRVKHIKEKDSALVNLLLGIVRRDYLLDSIKNIKFVKKSSYFYDLGTTTGNFVTAFGHIMHNSKWYGESEKRVREIFEDAEKNAPSIIFIDEIDAIAPKREEVTGEVERRVVSQLLTCMDGLKKRGKVIVIAATNRPNAIDPALRRVGRFDREIEVPVPDREGRLEILKIHTRNMPLDKDVDLKWLADVTYGYVGADLAGLCKEAAMSALRRILPEIKWKEEGELPRDVLEKLVVKKADFLNALKLVEPSAMREVLVEVPKVKWSDIGGLEEVKQALKEMVEWPLKYPESFERLGIAPPKGILLYGPPGCGKTLLAKAVANESGANFISVKGPELLSKWFGESEQRIRELFKRAKQVSPSIIFFDEIDALVPRRGKLIHEAAERIVSQLLTEMSGIEEMKGVVVIAATNRPDLVDPALLRAGRIDRFILVPAPDEKARLEILKIHTRNMPLDKDVDLKEIAKRTEGYSGADLEAICREAAMNALREDIKAKKVKRKHFEEAMKKVTSSITKELLEFYKKFVERRKKIETKKEEVAPAYIG
jgi:26S proteasome subunit P45 family